MVFHKDIAKHLETLSKEEALLTKRIQSLKTNIQESSDETKKKQLENRLQILQQRLDNLTTEKKKYRNENRKTAFIGLVIVAFVFFVLHIFDIVNFGDVLKEFQPKQQNPFQQ